MQKLTIGEYTLEHLSVSSDDQDLADWCNKPSSGSHWYFSYLIPKSEESHYIPHDDKKIITIDYTQATTVDELPDVDLQNPTPVFQEIIEMLETLEIH